MEGTAVEALKTERGRRGEEKGIIGQFGGKINAVVMGLK